MSVTDVVFLLSGVFIGGVIGGFTVYIMKERELKDILDIVDILASAIYDEE